MCIWGEVGCIFLLLSVLETRTLRITPMKRSARYLALLSTIRYDRDFRIYGGTPVSDHWPRADAFPSSGA